MPIMSNCTKANHTKGERTAQHSRKRKADVAIFLQDPDENLELELIEMTKKKQYEHRGNWENGNSWKSPYKLIPTPEKESDTADIAPHPPYACLKFHSTVSPLPQLSWANRDDVWRNMLHKDSAYLRDKNLFQRHPELQQSMRSILLDWLMEEIYPPKLHQFAYITDGACTEEEILSMELIIMKALKWCLTPMTVVSWLNVYLQVAYSKELQQFLLPQYPQQTYIQIVELLDLCILDIGCLEYPYSVLAASALYHFSNAELVEKVSGCEWTELETCIKHLLPFAMAIRDTGKLSKLKFFKGVDIEDMHNIQTHTGSLDLLDKAQARKEMLQEDNRVTPVPNGILTPPQSDKKQRTGDSE
ncbi:hypothetical protein GDO81_015768 [Engystomops pustulosus]|uniref:Cyclin C-terminal domain-containing protein n=1 Tax=Engystomops pustulosus TaxID=76066 RepID=A0AAV7ARR6_ENGPU|nr:hypothetical protein GDO81_015768 [Engystomops pustulosus]